MQDSGKQARSDDTHTLKYMLPDMLAKAYTGPINPPLDSTTKEDRGFNHPVTGLMLCPAGRNWSDLK